MGDLAEGAREMSSVASELDRLLALVAERLDLDHCREVDERYRRVMSWSAEPPAASFPLGLSWYMSRRICVRRKKSYPPGKALGPGRDLHKVRTLWYTVL